MPRLTRIIFLDVMPRLLFMKPLDLDEFKPTAAERPRLPQMGMVPGAKLHCKQ